MKKKIIIGSIIAVAILLCVGLTPIALADRQKDLDIDESKPSSRLTVSICLYYRIYPIQLPYSAWVILVDTDGFAFRFGRTSTLSGCTTFSGLTEGHTFNVFLFTLQVGIIVRTQETLTRGHAKWIYYISDSPP